jgi:hypothetical protein
VGDANALNSNQGGNLFHLFAMKQPDCVVQIMRTFRTPGKQLYFKMEKQMVRTW